MSNFSRIRIHFPALFISLILFIVPFFWFPQGAIDIGGDGSRLYFYDPLAFIQNVSLYSIAPEGKADVNPGFHAYIPYVGLLALIKYFVQTPHQLINVFNGIKLSVGFFAIYLILTEFTRGGNREGESPLADTVSAILAGIFYIIVSGSEKLIFHWVKALQSHDQLFLNPLMFFLFLRYLLTKNRAYLFVFLLISVIFSTNFAMASAPPFFAFYPLTFIFLYIYVTSIRKIKVSLSELTYVFILFLGLHAFHLLPELMAIVSNNTVATSVIFKESGENYFMAIRGLGLAVVSLFIPSPVSSLRWTSFVAPLAVVSGYLLGSKKSKAVLLTSIFFFITFFLVTANITNMGVTLYRKLFAIPGFSMFRNFYLQWAYVFIFFYALLFGLSLVEIFEKLRLKYLKIMVIGIVALFIIGFWPFLTGQSIDGIHWGSNGVKTAMIMDPRYEQTLAFIDTLPTDGKIVLFPLTDNYIQLIYGLNNAAYAGPPSISFLTGKKSFAGYQNFWPDPIPEDIMRYAREKNFAALTQIFSFFNIRYILHNTDPKIYEEKFPLFPNSYMMTSLPKTQAEYRAFVKNFPVKLIYSNEPYEIFEFGNAYYRPEVYIPDSLYKGNMTALLDKQEVSYRSAFLDTDVCQKNPFVQNFCKSDYKSPGAEITVNKINPTSYSINVKQPESDKPFLLVFQNSFHPGWKLSLNQEKPIAEEKHIQANMYANAWIVTAEDRKGQTDYTLSLTLENQRYFWYGLWITGATISLVSIYTLYKVIFRKNNEKD